jgi:hypothetical protein
MNITGLVIAIVAGIVIGLLKLERYVEDFGRRVPLVGNECSSQISALADCVC